MLPLRSCEWPVRMRPATSVGWFWASLAPVKEPNECPMRTTLALASVVNLSGGQVADDGVDGRGLKGGLDDSAGIRTGRVAVAELVEGKRGIVASPRIVDLGIRCAVKSRKCLITRPVIFRVRTAVDEEFDDLPGFLTGRTFGRTVPGTDVEYAALDLGLGHRAGFGEKRVHRTWLAEVAQWWDDNILRRGMNRYGDILTSLWAEWRTRLGVRYHCSRRAVRTTSE